MAQIQSSASVKESSRPLGFVAVGVEVSRPNMVLVFDQSSPALVFYASSSSSPECVCVCAF